MAISASDVKNLREMTGAGMMDCKKVLAEANGDIDQAVKLLRERGIAKAAKREGRIAAEGIVESYIHMGGKIGVLVEVNCETDFVARGDDFRVLARDICLQICSAAPRWVRREEVPADVIESEKEIYVKRAQETGKPQQTWDKIAEGMLKKFFQESCLLEQPFVKDPDKTIQDLLTALSGKVGEKMDVRRFARYQLGEGIDKPKSNLADDVQAELAKAAAKG